MGQAVIYTEKPNDEHIRGHRLPYFYLHAKAEEIEGFDCCSANIKVFELALSEGMFLADLVTTDDRVLRCIVYSTFVSHRMEGLICLIDDIEGITHMLTHYYKIDVFPSMYTHFEDELDEKYHETYLAIQKCIS